MLNNKGIQNISKLIEQIQQEASQQALIGDQLNSIIEQQAFIIKKLQSTLTKCQRNYTNNLVLLSKEIKKIQNINTDKTPKHWS